MTTDISTQGLLDIYSALREGDMGAPGEHVAREDQHRWKMAVIICGPELIGDLVRQIEGTIVECNTAYGGDRANTAYHMQLAEDHGYTDIANVDIMDADGSMTLPVSGGRHLTENYVGSHFADYDYYVVLSHFKGHAMAGYGGAIKNISIGIASSDGKSHK